MKTDGRTTIYANYTEKEFLSGSQEEIINRIIGILKDSLFIHEQNARETNYLIDYTYGDQDIKNKTKKTRTDINNTGVENWAYSCVDWKKTFLLGKPVMYASISDEAQEEISMLNKYNVYESKQSKDQDLWEEVLECGRAFRYNGSSPVNEDDEAPFDIINLDPDKTEVIYSSGIKKEQLMSYVNTRKVHFYFEMNPISKVEEQKNEIYDEFTVYTRKRQYVISNQFGEWKAISSKPIIVNEHYITEYYLNKKRMGIVEIAKDIFDDINYVENLDKDDIESFVNAIMVFTNAEVDKEGMDAIKEYGAVSIKSTEQKKASVELLQSRLKSLDTQIYYLRKISALHSILSIPQANNNGEVSNAETGKAMLTGQGFTSASIRIDGEELKFKECDKKSLKTLLKICRLNKDSKIKNLKVSDIDIKLNRDLSDNMLTKSTTLLNLATANIPPEIRNQVVGLFSDPVNVTKLQEQYEEEKRKVEEQLKKAQNSNNNENGINEQQNKIQDTKELDKQGQ